VSWPNAAAGLLAALLAVALAACSSLPRGSAGQALTAAQLESFQLSGRVNLRVEKEAFPGRVRWSHAPSRDELWFYSPVGSAVAHLVQDQQGALLAADVLGWDLPLAGLPYWVRGLPWPAAEAAKEQRDAQGRLSQLEQAGWTVSYLAWAGNGAQSLPAKLDLQGERMRLRLLIERWDRGNAP
jgi:outer membrane lipoprotein LolB